METANATLTILLGGVAAISLLVGGIGVMNISAEAPTVGGPGSGSRDGFSGGPGVGPMRRPAGR